MRWGFHHQNGYVREMRAPKHLYIYDIVRCVVLCACDCGLLHAAHLCQSRELANVLYRLCAELADYAHACCWLHYMWMCARVRLHRAVQNNALRGDRNLDMRAQGSL